MKSLIFIALMFVLNTTQASLKEGDCEVCVKTVERFSEQLKPDVRNNEELIIKEFKKFCKTLKNKEHKFCYFLGGVADAPTSIMKELAKPLVSYLPALKICEKLQKKDKQICELRYEKQIDFKTVDLKKLKVRDLKNILNVWDEDCEGCLEKTDFIKRIEELKPKYVREEL